MGDVLRHDIDVDCAAVEIRTAVRTALKLEFDQIVVLTELEKLECGSKSPPSACYLLHC